MWWWLAILPALLPPGNQGCGFIADGRPDPSLSEELYVSRVLTPPGAFTSGVEGPACDGAGNLYAVNFGRQGTIGIVTPAGEASLFLQLPPGSTGNGLRFDRRGRLLVADYTGHKVLRVDMAARAVEVLAHEPGFHQPNDLAVTAGDVVFASDPDWGGSTGRVWRVDPGGAVTLAQDRMGTTNGIEIGPGDRTLYVNESVQRNVWAFDLEVDGTLGHKRLLIRFPDHGLDGMRCDAAGNLYVTRYGKGTIAKLSPEGEVLREVELSGKKPSNLAFGGPDGRTCYVTLQDRGNVEVFRVEEPGRAWELARRR